MTQEREQTVLRRKAEAGRPAADGSPVTAERAIVQALSKVAQDLYDLPVQVRSIRESRRTLADLPEALDELSLLAILEGPEEGLGLIALPPATLSALIEVQTMGNLGKTTPAPRKPTRIDASMAADYIDAVMAMIEETLAETEAVVWAGGFRYASYLDDPRPLGLLLEDMGYRLWQIELGFGAGAERHGGLIWAVPVNGRGQSLRRAPGAGAGAEMSPPPSAGQEEAEWGNRLETSVLGAPTQLDAVLHRITLPLAAVLGLRPGQNLPLPEDALENLTLEGAGRRRLSAARLGQHRGMRALRLIEPEAEAAAPQAAPEPKSRRIVPPPFEAGASPFADRKPARKPKVPLDRIDSPAYDPAMAGPGAAAGLGPGGLGAGDLGTGDFGADLPPLGMALDGFGAALPEDEMPAMKIGSAF